MVLGKSNTKVAPSKYPKLLFHGLRSAQMLASLVVGTIMFYFIYHLTHDHWNTPWTFIFFTVASLLTVVALSATIVLHCCFGLNPRFNLFINSALFVLWGAGFGMLSWWASKTIFHMCNKVNWNDETGIMICRIYKALYAFGMLGFVSTILALLLDIYVFKRATRLGKYDAMRDPDNKHGSAAYHDKGSHMEFSGYNAQQHSQSSHPGYAVPEEQFEYDTTYHGAHSAR